jgi:hypothetical protein
MSSMILIFIKLLWRDCYFILFNSSFNFFNKFNFVQIIFFLRFIIVLLFIFTLLRIIFWNLFRNLLGFFIRWNKLFNIKYWSFLSNLKSFCIFSKILRVWDIINFCKHNSNRSYKCTMKNICGIKLLNWSWRSFR